MKNEKKSHTVILKMVGDKHNIKFQIGLSDKVTNEMCFVVYLFWSWINPCLIIKLVYIL
jgi:hypothetical protein